MNIVNDLLSSLNYQKEAYENSMKVEEEIYERETFKLQRKNGFIFRILKGTINAFEKLLESNEEKYKKEMCKVGDRYKKSMNELEQEYNKIKSLIAMIEKDS
jgi:esterase/lipase